MSTEKPDNASIEKIDIVVNTTENTTPAAIQARFTTLCDLDDEQMAALNKRVLRRIDWRMMPTITIMFLLNYLDRINVSNARLAGLQSDLGMSDTIWSAGISTFYVGYLIGNLWLARVRPSLLLPGMMIGWSICTITMPAVTSGAGFCIVRFFTGLCEAPFFPGITLMTSSWYTKAENPTRMAVWHAGNTISNIISGFLAAGILHHMGGIAGLYSWQWFFIIEGAVSILVGIISFFTLPDWPENTKWLSEEEREMAQYRVIVSNGGKVEQVGGTWDGLKDACKDPFTWMFCGMHFSLINAQSFKDFFPSIIKTFGFGELETYLVQAPPYAIAYLSALALAWSSGKFRESCYHIIVPIAASAVGIAVMISTENVGARYFGAILLVSGTYNGLNLQLSWETTLVPAPRSKKAALIAIANCVSQCSHWYSPYFFPRSQEPFYRLGGGLILFGCLCTALLAWAVKWWAKRLNKALDEAEGYRPGYIGLEVLDRLLEKDYDVTTLVRRQEAADELKQKNVKVVMGTIDDLDLITQQTASHDVVIHTATADHLPSVQAVVKGIKQRAADDKHTFYIHTSGCSFLSDDSHGKFSSDKIYTDTNPADLDARPDTSSHRGIDLAILEARNKLGTKAKLFIMLPPLIYGASSHGKLSIQVITMARFALKHKYAGYVGGGFIGKELKVAGKIEDATPLEIPSEQYEDLFGKYSDVVIASNARNRADRLDQLGWRPKHTDIRLAFRDEELPILLKESGVFKGYSKAAASGSG
ncbi:NAD(P)-binding protein [Aureobasidium subglaciale]|nr:NAD(P)-binding protein [Aureobasidium subglaciale]